MKIVLIIFAVIFAIVVLSIITLLVATRFSDGPKGPIPGGELTSGSYVDASQVNWKSVLGNKPVSEIELQLLNPTGSRTTGAFVYNGELYVPVDLGYVWRRLPNGIARYFLHIVWIFKDWHEKAAVDGRVVIRTGGNRYRLNAVRITDEALMSKFREHVSTAAGSVFKLLSVETNPEDIWFFRLDPRIVDAH